MSEAWNGDVRLVYDTRGSGPPLLLVHGLGYDRRGWGPLPVMKDGSRSPSPCSGRPPGGRPP